MPKEELYSPPLSQAGVPPDEEGLAQLLAEDPQHAAALFRLANLKIRQGNYTEAVDLLRRLIELEPENAKAHSNLGVAYLCAESFEEAASEFTQASLIDRSLAIPQLQLGLLSLKRNDYSTAAACFEKVLKLEPHNAEALVQLAELSLRQGDPSGARKLLDSAYTIEPDYPGLGVKLAHMYFSEGREHHLAGNRLEALKVWAAAYRLFPRGFTGNQNVVRQMRELVASFNAEHPIKHAIERIRRRVKGGEQLQSAFYPAFLDVFLALGLMPEAYESEENLKAEAARWKERSVEEGDYPYAHFRLALLYAYLGQIEAALDRVQHCQDRFPKKKQQGLRLPELAAVLKQILAMLQSGDDPAEVEERLWLEAGFDNPFELRVWKAVGAPPAEAACWKEAGFSARQTRSWRRHGLTPKDAAVWKHAGFGHPKTVRQWVKGGFEPHEAARWLRESGLSVEAAIQFKKAGFEEPRTAGDWSGVFLFPWEAKTWFELGFGAHEAAYWLESGVKDPYQALAEKQKTENVGADDPAGASERKENV